MAAVMITASAISVSDNSVIPTALSVSASSTVEVAKVIAKSSYTSTTTAVRINWNKVSGATGYRIYRYNSSTKKWDKIATIKKGSATSYRNSGLEAGTAYKYKVKAYIKIDGVNYWGEASSAITASTKLATVKLKGEARINSSATHPYNKQTSALTIRWNEVSGAERYQIYIKGGKYDSWTKVKTVKASKTSYTVTGLKRNTTYKFKVRATSSDVKGKFSSVQTLKTARIDYDQAGWKAMCRIVYHEVGMINSSVWDEPIVHVADCVVNRYEAAKYLNDSTWAPYYKKYSSIQDVIYKSGNFMSSSRLTKDGATYANCTAKVKLAVYGALYNKVTVSDIKHNKKIYYWSNTSSKPTSSKVEYTYKIPWGYFNIWNDYWG
ncbi:MAG: fibronectin type III domain-containing protein [Ruminococcus sp.]|nr:fibronectin type III domain-containing protein [Ruminococcus sp.]